MTTIDDLYATIADLDRPVAPMAAGLPTADDLAREVAYGDAMNAYLSAVWEAWGRIRAVAAVSVDTVPAWAYAAACTAEGATRRELATFAVWHGELIMRMRRSLERQAAAGPVTAGQLAAAGLPWEAALADGVVEP